MPIEVFVLIVFLYSVLVFVLLPNGALLATSVSLWVVYGAFLFIDLYKNQYTSGNGKASADFIQYVFKTFLYAAIIWLASLFFDFRYSFVAIAFFELFSSRFKGLSK